MSFFVCSVACRCSIKILFIKENVIEFFYKHFPVNFANYFRPAIYRTVHKKWSFPLRISLVNVTKVVVFYVGSWHSDTTFTVKQIDTDLKMFLIHVKVIFDPFNYLFKLRFCMGMVAEGCHSEKKKNKETKKSNMCFIKILSIKKLLINWIY